MVGSHTFVGSAVTQFNVGDEQLSIPRALCTCRQARPAHPGPHELNGMRAVGEALHAQGVSGLEPHLVRQAGGVWRACMKNSFSS